MSILSKETRIGIFAAIAIAALYFGYNFLRGKKFFTPYNTYYVIYEDVDGLVKSTPVYIKGFKVGQVEKISLIKDDTSNSILVALMIDDKVKLGRNSEAIIVSQDLLGSKAISLSVPEIIQPVENGDTLIGKKEADLTTSVSNMISPIRDKSEQVLITMDKVLSSLREVFNEKGTQNLSNGLIDLSATLHNLRSTTEKLNALATSESVHMRSLVRHAEGISEMLDDNTDQIGQSIVNFRRITDSLSQANIKTTIQSLNELSIQLAILTEKINKGEGSLGMLANDKQLYENMNKSAAELQAFLKDLQKYPGRYVHLSVFGKTEKPKEEKKK